MLERDRIFLNDYVQFGFMNHLTAAVAFYRAGIAAQATATAVRIQAEGKDEQAAALMASNLNDGPRVQKVLVARLYAELAAAIEDFGAFCDAVRYRAKSGIFKRYLDSEIGQVASFYDYVLQNRGTNLAYLLDLPVIADLRGTLDTETLEHIAFHYASLPLGMGRVAEQYRTVGNSAHGSQTASGLATDWQDRVNLILQVVDGPEKAPKGGLLVQAYNKLKHRFAVIENMGAFSQLPLAERCTIRHATHALDQEAAEALIQNTTGVVRVQAELAATLLLFDQHGIAL